MVHALFFIIDPHLTRTILEDEHSVFRGLEAHHALRLFSVVDHSRTTKKMNLWQPRYDLINPILKTSYNKIRFQK